MKKLLLVIALFSQYFAFAQFPNHLNVSLLPATRGNILDVVDFNNDTYEDLVYQNGLTGTIDLYQNNSSSFQKVNTAFGFPVITGNGNGTEGVISFDYNNDGYQDLLIMQSGATGYMRLFKNNCGSSFTEVSTSMNMPINPNITGQYITNDPIVVLSDYDKDNDIDIVFVRFALGEYKISALKNNGSSFLAPIDIISGFGSSIIPIIDFINYDNDLDEDLLIIKNTGVKQSCEILLYGNNGSGTFNLISGTGLTNSSAVGFANISDLNQDGFADILLGTKDTVQPGSPVNMGLKVFRNNGGLGTFTDITATYNTLSTTKGDYFLSHIFDLDNDGFNDVLWEVKRNDSTFSTPALMRNNGLNVFSNEHLNLIPSAATDTNSSMRYVVFDYDNNGTLDIFQPGGSSNAQLFSNSSSGNNYLAITLYSCSGMADPIGARVYVKSGTKRVYTTYTGQGNSTDGLAKSEKIHMGLGSNSFIDSLVVYWPNGNVTVRTNILANNHYKIINGNCRIAERLVFDLGNDSISYCNVDTAIFTAPNGYARYLWSTGDTTIGTKVTQSGWLYCNVFFYANCTLRDSIYISIGLGRIAQNDTTLLIGQSLNLDALPRYDCSLFGLPAYRIVNQGDNLGASLTYVNSRNGHHYYKFNAASDWSTAQRDALALGGQLVVINDQDENDFIAQEPSLNNTNLWIGLYRENNPNEPFKWVNCDELNYINWSNLFASPSTFPNEQHVYFRATGCPDAGTWKNTDETQSSPDPCESNIFGLVEFDNSKATSYLWNTSEITQSINVAPTTSSIYFVEVTQNNKTCFGSINIEMLDPSQLILFDSITDCTANSIQVTANTTGWQSYLWNTSDTARTIQITQTGWYTITALYGGSVGSDSIYVSLPKTGILSPDTTICAGSNLYIRGPILPFVVQQAHRQNFQSGIFPNYSSTSNFSFNSTKVLGPFANDSVTYLLPSIPVHDSITVSFDLYLHDTWEGNCGAVGPDRFKFYQGNSAVLNETFSNSPSCTQSYTNTGVAGNYPAFTGAAITGLPQRCHISGTTSKYTITKSFKHSAPSLVLSWLALLQDTSDNSSLCNESWSIDNVIVNYRVPTKVLWSTGDTSQNILFNATNASEMIWLRVPNGTDFCYDTITVNTYPGSLPLQLFAIDTLFECNVYSTILSMPPGHSKYRWSNGDTLESTNLYNEGWYSGYIENASGCASYDSVYYNVNHFSLNMTDTTICAGNTIKIESSLNNNATDFPGPANVAYIPGQILAGYTYLGAYRGHHYYQATVSGSWESSVQKAFAVGGYLACINDSLEQNFISNLTDSNVWIGLFKSRSGYYKWMNNDTLTYKHWGTSQPSISPKDYAYIMGSNCVQKGKWATHVNTDITAIDPCDKNAFGLLEITPTQYDYLWSTAATSSTILISPTADQIVNLTITRTKNNVASTCSAGEVNVNMVAAPIVTGKTENCLNSTSAYTTVSKTGRSYFWFVTGGTITSGQGTNRVNVNWNQVGAGTVVLRDSILATGCVIYSDTLRINTVQLFAPTITGDSTVCQGQLIFYSIPLDTNYTRTWFISGGTIVSGQGTDSIKVNWTGSGNVNVSVLVRHKPTNCNAPLASFPVTISVSPNPVMTGLDTACVNTVNLYTIPFNVGRKYVWTVAGGSIVSGQNTDSLRVLWGIGGTGSVQAMDSILASGCYAITSLKVVTISSLLVPIIVGSSAVCENSIVSYSTTGNIGRTYRWTITGGNIVSGLGTAAINVVWGTPGTGTLQVLDSINATGCKSVSNNFNVSIDSLPQPIINGSNAKCNGEITFYSIPSKAGHSYNWTVTLGNILSGQGTSTIQVIWPIIGSGTVSVIDSIVATGCSGTAPLFTVMVNAKPNPLISGIQSICVGTTASYTTPNNLGRTYTWLVNNGTIVSGQGSSTISVLWNVVGSGFLNVTDSVNLTGCKSVTSNYNVSVVAVPSPIITGKDTVCELSLQTYSVPFNAGRSYKWNVIGGSIVGGSGTNSVDVLWGAFGSGSITLSDSNNTTGCIGNATLANVYIQTLPQPVVNGATSVCVNGISSYNTPPSLGRTYTWVVTGGTIVSGFGTAGIDVNWGSVGTGTVVVTDSIDATGCYGVSATITVNIQAKPSTFISGTNTICELGIAMYGTINNLNKFYDWNVLGGNINFGQGTSNISVTWASAGVGYVYLTDSLIGANCSASTYLGVQVNSIPSAGFNYAQTAGGVKLTPIDNTVSCKWYFGDGDSSYTFSPYHAYANNGIYTVTLQTRSIFGCLNESSTDVNISTVGLSQEALAHHFKFVAQPNPFTEQTKLTLTLKESADISLEVFDMSGRLVHTYTQGQLHLAGTYEFGFNSADFQTSGGVYLVRIKVNEDYRHLRIIELGR